MGRRTKKEECYDAYHDGFKKGYEHGMARVVAHLDSELRDLEGQKKIIEKIRNWIWQNYEEYLPRFGWDEPTKYEKKFCFVTTYSYRGEDVEVFCDDDGQCYYFYYNGKSHNCGSFNPYYEDCIKAIIDHDKDDICNFSAKGFYGAFCKYADWEHTKVEFWFRGDLVETFDVDENDPESVMKIWQECEHRLERLWQNPEFLKAEEARKAGGDLYFNELVEKAE